MKQGTIFNAIRKSSGMPVMVRKYDPHSKGIKLAEFTVDRLVSIIGETEWYECHIKDHPLPKVGKIDRKYQLFTRFFDFHKVTKSPAKAGE